MTGKEYYWPLYRFSYFRFIRIMVRMNCYYVYAIRNDNYSFLILQPEHEQGSRINYFDLVYSTIREKISSVLLCIFVKTPCVI